MKLFNKKTNQPVQVGDLVTSFRGEQASVTSWIDPHKIGSEGKMTVEFAPGEIGEHYVSGTYYPSVFNCEFRDA